MTLLPDFLYPLALSACVVHLTRNSHCAPIIQNKVDQKEDHTGYLLFRVECVYRGRIDVVSMASMIIYWNRNYCVDFLDKMISYCGCEDTILAQNQMIFLSSFKMVAATRLWSILQIDIFNANEVADWKNL